MPSTIINDRIDGLRITVHDVYYYQLRGRKTDDICKILGITPEQVDAANRYINDHQAEVAAVYERFEARAARGNPPEIQALRKGSEERMQAWIKERRRLAQERNGEGTACGR